MPVLNGLDTTIELTRHAQALRAQGYDVALRYYSNNASKNLSLGEARALSGAGQAYRMAREVIGQPFGSAIYFAVDYDPTQADIDGVIGNYFTGVHAAFYVANEGQPSYRTGIYGSGLCCGTLVERGQAGLGWLSQSTALPARANTPSRSAMT